MKLWHAKYVSRVPGGGQQVLEEDFYMPAAEDVRRKLRAQGFWPIKIEERGQPFLEWVDVRSGTWQAQLLRALRFQTANMSAGTALLNIIEGETDDRKRVAFLPCRTVLKAGGSFANALRALRLFDAATMAIITAGERAGDLKGVIAHAIQHVEDKGSQMKVFMAALGWMVFDIFSVISTVYSTQYGFIPYLEKTGTKATDPEALQKFNDALNLGKTLNMVMLLILTLGSVAVVGIAALFWFNRSKPDHFANRLFQKLPLFAQYLQDSTMNDTAKLMARLLRGNVPLDEAIKIIIESALEPSVRTYWSECRKRILAGVEPARAMARAPLTRSEKDQLGTIQSVEHLVEVYEGIAGERSLMAKAGQKKIVMVGMMLLFGTFGAVVLLMIYLLMVQNQGFMDSLSDLRGSASG